MLPGDVPPTPRTWACSTAPAEPNSVYQCDVITGYLEEYGYTVERYAFTDTNDVTSVAQTAADNSDVIYIPTDNTAASNTEGHCQRGAARRCPRHRR